MSRLNRFKGPRAAGTHKPGEAAAASRLGAPRAGDIYLGPEPQGGRGGRARERDSRWKAQAGAAAGAEGRTRESPGSAQGAHMASQVQRLGCRAGVGGPLEAAARRRARRHLGSPSACRSRPRGRPPAKALAQASPLFGGVVALLAVRWSVALGGTRGGCLAPRPRGAARPRGDGPACPALDTAPARAQRAPSARRRRPKVVVGIAQKAFSHSFFGDLTAEL
jgi:hypothetical protein